MAAKPPDEVPDEFKEDVAKLHKPLAAILVGKEIFWAAQAALGASDTSRWRTWRTAGTPQRRQGRMARDGENGFNVHTSAFTAMRLLQAVRVAASLVRGGNQTDHSAGQAGPSKAPLEVLCDRRQLEDAYVAIHGTPKPRLEFQGSDGYLKKQWRLIAKGELGYIPAKHIVSALPEEGERPSSTHKKITVDGWDREEEEVRSHPTSRRQLERLHQTFRTTLLMCTAALLVTKAELDDWYDWFYGEDIRVTPPCCLQSAMRGGRSTRWCTKAPPSPMPSRISGATSSSGSERSMSTSTGRRRRGRTRARHLRCGRLSGRSRRRGEKAPGPRGRPIVNGPSSPPLA